MRTAEDAPPRSAYVHVPFCRRRCGYCNFAVIAGRDDLAEAVLTAIESELGSLEARPELDTLYFGGGTPTQLSLPQLDRLCQSAERFSLAAGYEWTVEANPEDVSREMIDLLAARGVNRLSLGVQSFHAEKLKRLERDHTAGDATAAVRWARQAGMQVSIDLIFAAPGETLDAWRRDVSRGIGLEPEHVSAYGLTYEKGTTFWNRRQRGDLTEVDEGLAREMYLAAIDDLAAAGLKHYEVSNFARRGCRSRHNETYWAGLGYYAAGPGAARYVDGVRETNHRSTTTYLKRIQAGQSPVAERERLDAEQRARERLILGLRRLEGVDRAEFAEATGRRIDDLVGEAIERFVAAGLLADEGNRIWLTREGLLLSDSLWPELL